MPPDMAISMRHTKLKAEEAALLAGEINKPSWESRNEGIHERVSFEDTIWGFDLAGGIFYKTPLRVTFVKPDSRAEKAGIRPGDKLLRINDIDTSTLTIQQAHDIIVESGIHLKLSVTSPDDEEDAYYCYEDPIVDGYDSEEERRLEEERARKRRVCAKVSHFWSLQWPWVSKRKLIYRESNCFMVPSKYEDQRREIYPPLPTLRYTDEVVHFTGDEDQPNKKRIPTLTEVKERARKSRQEKIANGDAASDVTGETDEPVSYMTDDEQLANGDSKTPVIAENDKEMSEAEPENNEIPSIEETDEEPSVKEDTEQNGPVNENINDSLSPIPEAADEPNFTPEDAAEESIENEAVEIDSEETEINGDVNEDDVLNEVLGKSESPRGEEDNILDSILSDEGQNLENSESNNER